jgi:hypothetical protein
LTIDVSQLRKAFQAEAALAALVGAESRDDEGSARPIADFLETQPTFLAHPAESVTNELGVPLVLVFPPVVHVLSSLLP